MVIIKFLLFDRNEELVGTLKKIERATHTEEINGEDVLEISLYDDQKIEKEYRVLYKSIYGHWHEFIIKGIEEIREGDSIRKELFCESSIYELWGDYIEDKRPSGAAVLALTEALAPTRWEVGFVDNLGESYTNFYRCSAKEAVNKVLEAWQGEIRTRVIVSGNKITRRYVDILQRRGNDLGKRFTYTKDIEAITRSVEREDVITALYGYGKGEEIEDEDGEATGGFGRRIDFAEVNNGKSYVTNEDARLIWGRHNSDGTKSHVFGKVEFDDIEDKEELLQLTKDKLEELSMPYITYQATVLDLKALGFEHEGTELGDSVGVIDKEFSPELRVNARVIKIVRDLLEPENNNITLGNFIHDFTDALIEQEDYINNFRDKQGIWDRSTIINPDRTLDARWLQDLMNEINNDMNSQGGYVYMSDEGDGIVTYDRPIDQNPTMAIQIKGGGFRIANSKLPNGEFDWRTFGTGDGFVADMINTGVLNANLIKAGILMDRQGNTSLDLDNGRLIAKQNNGSEVRLDANNGIYYREGGSNYQTNYLYDIITLTGLNNFPGSPRWVNLPAVYRGKQFKAVAVLTDAYGHTASSAYDSLSMQRVVSYVDRPNIDYENARVPVVGYVSTRNPSNGRVEFWPIQVQILVQY